MMIMMMMMILFQDNKLSKPLTPEFSFCINFF